MFDYITNAYGDLTGSIPYNMITQKDEKEEKNALNSRFHHYVEVHYSCASCNGVYVFQMTNSGKNYRNGNYIRPHKIIETINLVANNK